MLSSCQVLCSKRGKSNCLRNYGKTDQSTLTNCPKYKLVHLEHFHVMSLHLFSFLFFQENELTTSTRKNSLRKTPNLDFRPNRKHLMFRNKQTPGDRMFENEKSSDNLRQTENSLIALVPAPLWRLAG